MHNTKLDFCGFNKYSNHVRGQAMHHLDVLKTKLKAINGVIELPTQQNPFICTPVFCGDNILGVSVTNLGNYPFISIDVFVAVISLLKLSPNNEAVNGNVMKYKLGDGDLSTNSVEGHIGSLIYGKSLGDTIFRRITPIAKILEWAGVCTIGTGCLRLV